MKQQLLISKQFEVFQASVNILKDEIKILQEFQAKQDELNRRNQDILTIKDNTIQILQILLGQQQAIKRIEEEQQKQQQQISTIIEEQKLKQQEPPTLIEEQQQQEPQTNIQSKKQEQQQEPPTPIERKIQSLNKAKEIKHNSYVYSITELSDLRIATGDSAGYLTLFTVDYEKEQWTKIKEEKGHNDCITSLCELSGNRLVSSSYKTLKVWNISNNTITHIKTLE